jgi:predicted phage terminase large subunit-like protein
MTPDHHAVLSPGIFARTVGNGEWVLAPHLQLISQRLARAAKEGGARIIISMPPRHGKSSLVSEHFPAWYLGLYPDKRIILASYEAVFAATWGRKARNLLTNYGHLFGGVKVSSDSSAANKWDIAGRKGGMITAGYEGAITGYGGNFVIFDDLIKNASEANSETIRETTWEFCKSTAYTRLAPRASLVAIGTRWHEDDYIGRMIREWTHIKWEIYSFPAIAEENDILGRKPGDPLWPEMYGVAALEDIRLTQGPYNWSALYQGHPTPPEGEMFKRAWFPIVNSVPEGCEWCRAWDKAATTKKTSDYSVGVLMAKAHDGVYYVCDVVRGKWTPGDRNKIIKTTSLADFAQYKYKYTIVVEEEPGSSGKESAAFSVKDLAGIKVKTDKVTGDKVSRAGPLASQAEGGNVRLLRGDWHREYLDEMAGFPFGTHDDQVDASSGAFNHLALARRLTAYVL